MSFTMQPNGAGGIGVTIIESVNFKSQGNVVTKANAIHKEKRFLSGGSSLYRVCSITYH